MLVYLDGQYLPKDQATVSVDDRGFLFGDGVYEVTRAIGGRLFEEEGHWERLRMGLGELAIVADRIDRGKIREIYEHLLEENGHTAPDSDATVYLQITRGCAPRSHAFPGPGCVPTIYAFASPFRIPTDLRRSGVDAIAHPDIRWARCDIKTINLLPNVVAKQRAVEAGAWEAVLFRDGAITEGSSTNVFGVLDGELRTYPTSNYILPGITRDVILQLARELNIPIRERPIFANEVSRLEELFVTGTTTDVQPIVRLDGRPIGDGVVGGVARTLQEALMERMGSVPAASTA
ncbi:MAG: aminotransferase class IV [Gemmatimonadota bacterium]